MIPFLHSVARAYASRYSDLSEVLFLFPNKRSGTFFLKYLKEELHNHAAIAPEVKTISEFIGDVSGRVAASRIDLLFMLYRCYRHLLGLPDREEGDDEAVNFDSFLGWGEAVLGDFNEVDLYLADPEEVFKNVKDFREISSTFLTEEQRRVMQEYFGRTDPGDPTRFWNNFEDEEHLSEAKRRFLHLWRAMAPLYENLNKELKEVGLAYTGGMYRLAASRLTEEDVMEILPYKKVVAVGFNALSTSEQTIFAALRDTDGYEGFDAFADFFWDATGPILSKEINSASKFVESNIRAFPCPDWALPVLKLSDKETLPDVMRVVASPSNAAQVKIAGEILAELRGKLSGDEFKNAKVAVVLPDENLLLPMLYSLPGGMGDVNLTMGYPLRLTSVVPFVNLFRRLYNSMRILDGEKAFFNRDLKLFLSHPFSHACFSTDAINYINGYISESHRLMVTVSEIGAFSPKLAAILDGLNQSFTPHDTLAYLDTILSEVEEALPGRKEAMVKSRLEISHISVYRDALRRLDDILCEYDMKMRPMTVFRLADRLLAGESVGFEGEPLTGLQVMGLLETRSIDFDHILILSANEKVLPRRARTRSFIPDSLRHAYGMPPANYAEGIFAYYFYRMISRAKGVAMIYDARSGGGLRSGDVSRYVLQLRHLFAKDLLKEEDWKFILSGKEPYDPSIDKIDKTGVPVKEIKEQLDLFCDKDSRKNLSASALQAYRECQVKFYYQSVLGISTDNEPSEFIDAIAAGNILHDVMLKIYLPEKDMQGKVLDTPLLIKRETIDRMLDDIEGLERLVRHCVNAEHYGYKDEKLDTPLTGTTEMVARHIVEQVKGILRHDRELTPFKYYGGEIKYRLDVKLQSGRHVNFKFAIDRLDEITVDGDGVLRIVDYKTGSLKLEAGSIEELFKGDWRSEQVFQLFTYAWLLGKIELPFTTENVRMEIYDVPGMQNGEVNLPMVGIADDSGNLSDAPVTITNYDMVSQEFSAGMEKMIDSIFEAPRFEACEETECNLCALRTLCRR